MKTLVIGAGEVGTSLYSVLRDVFKSDIIDKDERVLGKFKIIHICFPCYPNEEDKFKEAVLEYKKKFGAEYVVIHSTVPVGLTKSFKDKKTAHSPIRGKHPDLQKSIRTFVKFVGVNDYQTGRTLKDYFTKAGIKTHIVLNSDNTELGKILSTTKYGHDICFMKDAKALCDKLECDFNLVYTLFTETYNAGYDDMSGSSFSKFHRPVLSYEPGPIGGHCVVQNCYLLDDPLTEYVKKRNDEYSLR